MSIDKGNIDELLGRDVYGTEGEKIGSAGQVFLDDATGRPEWVTVKTGLFGTKESFVPLQRADLSDRGLQVAYDKDRIKDAPRQDTGEGHLSREQDSELYRHYGLADPSEESDAAAEPGRADRRDTDGVGDVDTSRREGTEEGERAGLGDRARRSSAQSRKDEGGTRGDDDAMTRSEEQLRVGTQSREAGRARLRKHVVTEEQTVTVPVSHEEVVLEREPITDDNRDEAGSGPEISEAEHEVVLREERPVVDKETVPVERVRLDTQTVTDEEQVTDTVRKEQIDTQGVDDRAGVDRDDR